MFAPSGVMPSSFPGNSGALPGPLRAELIGETPLASEPSSSSGSREPVHHWLLSRIRMQYGCGVNVNRHVRNSNIYLLTALCCLGKPSICLDKVAYACYIQHDIHQTDNISIACMYV